MFKILIFNDEALASLITLITIEVSEIRLWFSIRSMNELTTFLMYANRVVTMAMCVCRCLCCITDEKIQISSAMTSSSVHAAARAPAGTCWLSIFQDSGCLYVRRSRCDMEIRLFGRKFHSTPFTTPARDSFVWPPFLLPLSPLLHSVILLLHFYHSATTHTPMLR